MASITLSSVTKNFGAISVLNETNLEIKDGEFLTLVGPSGCGKSTTLRIIAGLEAQTNGDVRIGGKSVNKLRASQRDLAMVFQSYALYPHLTVRQNLEVPLKLRDLNFRERIPFFGSMFTDAKTKNESIKRIVHEVSETLQISHLLNRKPGQLSGGQRQRVALGRAMVRKPAAFLMDEPLSNLDAGLRVHMRAELSELHKTLKTTFVYVTHDQAEALTMSDRMAVMMEGDILQIGKPDEVYNNPNSIRVAEFVGSPKINIIPCDSNSDGIVSCMGLTLERALENNRTKATSMGIRPEHLQLMRNGSDNCFVGRLKYKENLGSDIFLHTVTKDPQIKLIVRSSPNEGQGLNVGDELYFERNPGKAIVFANDGKHLSLTPPKLEKKNN